MWFFHWTYLQNSEHETKQTILAQSLQICDVKVPSPERATGTVVWLLFFYVIVIIWLPLHRHTHKNSHTLTNTRTRTTTEQNNCRIVRQTTCCLVGVDLPKIGPKTNSRWHVSCFCASKPETNETFSHTNICNCSQLSESSETQSIMKETFQTREWTE